MTGSPSPVQLFRAAQGSPKGVNFEETLYWGPCRLMESDRPVTTHSYNHLVNPLGQTLGASWSNHMSNTNFG